MNTRAEAHRKRLEKVAARAWRMECELAQLVAETDCSLSEAAVIMNLSYPSVTIYWRRIKARMRAQAR